MEAVAILFSERTGEPVPHVRSCSTSDFVAKMPFDTVEELKYFMGDSLDEEASSLLALMYPEMGFHDDRAKGKSQWFHLGENSADDGGNASPGGSQGGANSPERARADSAQVVEETGDNIYVLDPKAHASVHKQEVSASARAKRAKRAQRKFSC